jgi:hypothetical protein
VLKNQIKSTFGTWHFVEICRLRQVDISWKFVRQQKIGYPSEFQAFLLDKNLAQEKIEFTDCFP